MQMHHLYTNNSGMQYSWLRWVFFLCTEDIAKFILCTEDIAKFKLRTIYSKDIFELKLFHRPDKPRIPFEEDGGEADEREVQKNRICPVN